MENRGNHTKRKNINQNINYNYNRKMSQKRKAAIIRKRKKRELAIKIKMGIILVTTAIFLILGVNAAKNYSKMSSLNKNNTVNAAVDHNYQKDDYENATLAVDNSSKYKFKYAKKGTSYKEITSDKVNTPYVALLDVEKNEFIAGKKYEAKIYPASMTKVMSLIVIAENLPDLSKKYTFGFEMLNDLYLQQASVAGFLADEEVTYEDLLYAMILPSGADGAAALAEIVAGSENEFANMMNKKCEELGLTHTHFMNATGLYDDNQYTTPSEMAMIMNYAMKNTVCAKVLSTVNYTTSKTSKHPEGIQLTNTMFSRMYGNEVENVEIIAGKTGYVDQAKNCLVSYAKKGDRHYICVTAAASNKWHNIFDTFEVYGNYLP